MPSTTYTSNSSSFNPVPFQFRMKKPGSHCTGGDSLYLNPTKILSRYAMFCVKTGIKLEIIAHRPFSPSEVFGLFSSHIDHLLLTTVQITPYVDGHPGHHGPLRL
ncbi:hypothetical protein Tcan_00905, partial [Toxocara canis]